MTLILDAKTEQTIQREIDLGHNVDAAGVIARAVSLLAGQEDWFLRNREVINDHLQQGIDEMERGEVISADEARNQLRAYVDELPG